jgi:hypothetical protein
MKNETSGTCSMHEGDEKYNKILARKPKRKRPFGKWEHNIKVDITKIR